MFGKLLPREGNFFEMFNQHADKIVEAARAFSQLVATTSQREGRLPPWKWPPRAGESVLL